MSAARLWLVRHAQPLVAQGVCYGVTDMPACVDDTRRAAQALARVLPSGASVRMSGLRRAQRLALALVALRPDLDQPEADPRLNEMDFGRWEMQAWDRIERSAFDAWTDDFAGHRFGGRESVNDMLERVGQVLAALPRQGVQDHVWVTHAGVIRVAQHLVQSPGQVLTAELWPRQTVPFGAVTVLELPGAPS